MADTPFEIAVGDPVSPFTPAPRMAEGFLELADPDAVGGFDDEERAHDENLALVLPDDVLKTYASKLLEDIGRDIDTDKERDELLKKALDALGFDRSEDVRSDPFPGASAATHPLLAEACTDMAARIMKELLPAGGPARARILGRQDPWKVKKGERVADYLNYQCTIEMPEYPEELDRLAMMLGPVGEGWLKLRWDLSDDRPRSDFVPSSDIAMPYSATDAETSPRLTHILRVYDYEVSENVASGLWRRVDLGPADESDDDASAKTREKVEKIEGRGTSGETEDDRHVVYECHAIMTIEELGDDADGVALPYIWTLSKANGNVLSLRRGWWEGDEDRARIPFFHQFALFPWQGGRPLGLFHLIGGLTKGATGAMRALLDSAMINNTPGGIRLRGNRNRVNGGEINFRPFEWTEVDAPGVTDVRQVAMPLPSNPPSEILFRLLEFLVNSGRRFASVATQTVMDAPANQPVGTTLALIEQDSMVYSAIHKRLHRAQGRFLRALHDFDYHYLDDQAVARTHGGELVVSYRDFDGEADIIPVSDPDVFSAIQRDARAEAVLQLALKARETGTGVDLRQAFVQRAEALGAPDVEALFPEPPQAQPLDPISELMALQQGMPVAPFPGQDHAAHVAFHMATIQDPAYAPLLQMIGPQWQALVAGHAAWQRRQEIEAALGQPLPPPGQPLPPPLAAQVAQAAAQVGQAISAQRAEAAQAEGDGGIDDAYEAVEMAKVEQRREEALLKDEQARARIILDNRKVDADLGKTAAKLVADADQADAELTAEERMQEDRIEADLTEKLISEMGAGSDGRRGAAPDAAAARPSGRGQRDRG